MSDQLAEYVIVGGEFKHQDTTKQIQLQFKLLQNGHQTYARITRGHDYIARVANQSGYIGDYPVQTNGAQITISTADLVDLVPDKYKLEIWETYTDASGKKQTSIWPAPDAQVPFEVHANIADSIGKKVKEIGFQEVVNAAVEATVKDHDQKYIDQQISDAYAKAKADVYAEVEREFENGKW